RHGTGAMAEGVLLGGGHLRERPPELGDEEDGIVAEPARPARRIGQHALDDALDDRLVPPWRPERQQATKARAPPGGPGDRRHEARDPLGLPEPRPAV